MNGDVIRRRQHVTVRVYAHKDNGHGGTTVDFDTFTDYTREVELEIDVAGLFNELGRKAARSKGGRAAACGKLVVAKRLTKGAAA